MPVRPPILRLAPLLAALCAGPAPAESLGAGPDCGGDAFSSAEVIEHRPPRRGPLTAVPDTLCADLAPQGPGTDLRIDAYPVITPQVGRGRGGVPYEGVRHDRRVLDRAGPDRAWRDPPGLPAAPPAFPPDGPDHRRALPPPPE